MQLIAKHFLKRNEAAIVENLKFMAERRKIKCETLIGQIFNLSNNKGGGIAQWLAFLLLDPAAPGSDPGSAEIFSLYCLLRGQCRVRTHLVLQGISQMQFAV